jgi:hypothetical protein
MVTADLGPLGCDERWWERVRVILAFVSPELEAKIMRRVRRLSKWVRRMLRISSVSNTLGT